MLFKSNTQGIKQTFYKEAVKFYLKLHPRIQKLLYRYVNTLGNLNNVRCFQGLLHQV